MDISDLREKAYQVCKNYIGGSWNKITAEEIVIEKLSGGYINTILKLSLPAGIKNAAGEPTLVLMRNMIGLFDEGYFGCMNENIIVTLLAEKKITPKVYGVFDGGRLDQFIPSRTLKYEDFENPEILTDVLKKLAHMHSLNLPINKNPEFLYDKIESLLEKALNDLSKQIKGETKRQEVWEKFLALNPRQEWKWLMSLRDSSNSPVVFSHNDFYSNNILVLDNPEEDFVKFIDFETAGYNFRAFDIVGLFCSCCLVIIPESPYIKLDIDKYPTVEDQRHIIQVYLNEFHKINENNCKDDNVDKLLEECQSFVVIFCFLWTIFLLFTPHRSNSCDWILFSDMFLNGYLNLKEKFMKL